MDLYDLLQGKLYLFFTFITLPINCLTTAVKKVYALHAAEILTFYMALISEVLW
jgi:hypothetical protein